jgi:tetratricopeptide (TPR) repeat protein
MRFLSALIASFLLLIGATWADEGHHHALSKEEIGSVQFATSCAPQVAVPFNRAVALLHSFQYEKTREGFVEIVKQDPKCAMAYWGIAMSHYHGLWDNGDMNAGRSALRKAQEIEAATPSTTAREKSYIDALTEIYKQDAQDKIAHAQHFEQKMAEMQAAYRDDSEAAIFHALTLAITAPKTDKTFANQRKCGEILEPIFAKNPHHPGVAHYIIHCYDNPVLAERGLGAARLYAKIAPASAHANHMPSHIFTRVGLWDESITSNLRSAELASADEAASQTGEARDQHLHAMDYLEYAYLQSGRVKQAKAVVDEMNSLKPVAGISLTGGYGNAAIPVRYALERCDWQLASALEASGEGVPWAQAITWMGIGIGSARTGNLEKAARAERTLASLRDSSASQSQYWSNQIEVQRREVAAWISEKGGKSADGIAMMRSAAELEESMDKHAVTPGAVIPAREMLAELLAIHKQAQAALEEYQTVLKVAPNRFNALYGAASAAEEAGNAVLAHELLNKLNEVAVGDERQELVSARKKLATIATPRNETTVRTSSGIK